MNRAMNSHNKGILRSETMSKETKHKGFTRRSFGGFTIIELLTVMSIVIIIMALLVPGLNRVRKIAKDVTQKAAFYDIEKSLADYRNDHQDEFPDSNALDFDTPRLPYSGAMKLCEAMMGQDGMGLHQNSRLMAVPGNDKDGDTMYPFDLCNRTAADQYSAQQTRSIKKRTRYLENLNIRPVKLNMLYGTPNPSPYSASGVCAVLADVYKRASITACTELAGEKIGMPILYYRADPRKNSHDPNEPTTSNPDNIYDYRDNHDLVRLGLPWDASIMPPMGDMTTTPRGPTIWFYERITNPDVTSAPTPFRKEEYILISAGWDGTFGTNDDIFNFRR